jgi:surface protein
MSEMFYGCSALQTIFCNDDWSANTVLDYWSTDMFSGCTSLVGGNGTAYDENHTNVAYAHPDEEGNPGYFTAKDEVYAVLESDNETLTLYYDNQRASRGGGDWTLWNCDKVKTVILDESMQDARPKSTKYWFCEFFALTEIQHLEYLNTSEVTDMSHMFYCPSLTELDLSKFNTDKVTDMSRMFQSC